MEINKVLKKGIIVSAIGKYSYYIIQFILLAVLSRILTPDEFGIVAIVNIFLAFFSLLIDMGLGPAIIQNKQLVSNQISSIFNFSILLSLIFSILFAICAKPIAVFFSNTSLIGVILTMAITLFTSGLNMVPSAVILKRKDFITINSAQIVSSIIGGAICIILALWGFSYYAIIINSIIKNIIIFLLTFSKSKIKISKNIKLDDIKKIFSFSRNQFLFNFINYFSRSLDNILIGKIMSPKDLAYYDKAYTLSLYPNQILASVITPVIQPVLSDFEKQKNIIKDTFLQISHIMALIGLPLTVYLCFSAKEIIYCFFGPQWGGSVLTFQILAISIWIQMIASEFGAFFQSSNRTDLLLFSGLLSAFLNILGIILGVLKGRIEYIALMLAISFSVNFVQSIFLLMKKTFKANQKEFYRKLVDPLIIALLILVIMMCICFFLNGKNLILMFFVKTGASLLFFIVGIILTGNLSLIKKLIKR